MNVRSGGSYVADPDTGHEKLVEQTAQEAGSRIERTKAPETTPALPPAGGDPPPPPAEKPAASRRRGANAQE